MRRYLPHTEPSSFSMSIASYLSQDSRHNVHKDSGSICLLWVYKNPAMIGEVPLVLHIIVSVFADGFRSDHQSLLPDQTCGKPCNSAS